MKQLKWVSPDTLKTNPRNARTHSKKQIRQIADSIRAFGFVVALLVDENGMLVAGHSRLEPAKLLGLSEVPVIVLKGLSEAKKRALLLADNKIAENAGWDRKRLAMELPELTELLVDEALDISITGFESVEIDQIVIDFEEDSADPADAIESAWQSDQAVSKPGDLWQLGSHRLLCGDARNSGHLDRLMEQDRAAMAFLGRAKHAEFAMASGEMSHADFTAFLVQTMGTAAKVSGDGAVHYVCMDWRHIAELIDAGREVYGDMLNLVVWAKSNSGQGSFYRSQHELIGVFRVGGAKHLNNVELGRHGRSRSNIWHYAGVNTFRAGRVSNGVIRESYHRIDGTCSCTMLSR
jgi:ParB/Sulfiredoxin domain